MGKKIIVLNGSPRKNGNTSALTAEFKRGAEEAGHEVTEFFLGQMKINGCLGCWSGGKDPEHPCSQRDDMDQIYPLYQEADVVALASPLYYWSISGFLKNAFDRLFAVAEADPTYEPVTAMATAQCATASIITLFLCPFITAAFDKYMMRNQKGIYSPEGWAYEKGLAMMGKAKA